MLKEFFKNLVTQAPKKLDKTVSYTFKEIEGKTHLTIVSLSEHNLNIINLSDDRVKELKHAIRYFDSLTSGDKKSE